MLSFISLPESVSSVGSGAFSNCRSLRKIVLRDHITRLEDCTFESCPALECITVPENATFIGERAFAGGRGLASSTIPCSVTSIGERTFERCPSLSVFKLHLDDPEIIRYYHSMQCAVCGNPVMIAEKPSEQDGVFHGWADVALKDGNTVCKGCAEKTRIMFPLRSTKTFAVSSARFGSGSFNGKTIDGKGWINHFDTVSAEDLPETVYCRMFQSCYAIIIS